MISVLIAAKCCHLQDDLSAAVFYKAWDQVIDILRAYRPNTQPTEIPFRFLESIDRRLFRATRDSESHYLRTSYMILMLDRNTAANANAIAPSRGDHNA
jgi:hypothetical protein